MNKETLNSKIFKMLAALVLVTTLILLLLVWNSNSKSIYENLASRLALSENILARELSNHQQSINENTKQFFNTPVFTQLLDQANANLLLAYLDEYNAQIGSTFISLSYNKSIIVSNSGDFAYSINNKLFQQHIKSLEKKKHMATLIVLDNQLMWVLWQAIKDKSENNIAYSATGFLVNEAFLSPLKELVNEDVSIYLNTETPYLASSLKSSKRKLSYLEESLINNGSNFLLKLNTFTNSNSLFSSKFPSASLGGANSIIYVSADGWPLKDKFLKLQISFGAFSIVAIIITMFVGHFLAKQITRPIEFISIYAAKIAKGDYSGKLEVDTCTLELDELLKAFKIMEKGVRERESEIAYQAQRDMQTRLFNRSYIKNMLEKYFNSGKHFQVVGINILGFRGINDVFGYQLGDLCLQELAHRVILLGGTSARLTGGELLWVPEKPLSFDEIKTIKNNLEDDIHTTHISLPMKTSVGIIQCPQDTQNCEDLFRRMNIVIDEAQMSRKLILQFNNCLEEKYLRKIAIISKLKNALSSNSHELSLHYQPKLNLQTNAVEHAEALVRWEDHDLGFISPEEFIGIAEHAGFMNAVTQWVLTRAVRDVIAFREQGVQVCIAVNISAQDLLSDKFMAFAGKLLDDNKLDHNAISFELTEGVIVREPEKAIKHMKMMRDEGYNLAIDDFGTGYSSLSYLAKLPVNILKIDQCFVIPLASQQSEQAICHSVIQLAKSFNMQVVAEGIEDEASLKMLRAWGCEYGQGYFICRPAAAEQFVSWMLKHKDNVFANSNAESGLLRTE